ncbi:putative acetolactate synthase [Magnetofaba australis IT-1]|uniref:Putative acetolactate synthase n=2 Tax=Magnetofaba TaxID=1472292 RepID=A0A1Y2K3Q1_9PROT|nr:putative acetolactate synthase [Magnetofaba australis IT-1]
MYLVDALGQNPDITAIPNHHEQASSIAAEAYARIHGRLGACLVTTGPGATNAITGVTGAWIESVPMIVISGQVKRADLIGDTGVRQMGPQEVDIVSMVKPVTKYAVTVMDSQQIRIHLEEALHAATSGRRGPVWIDVPLDIQASKIDPETLPGMTPPPVSDAGADDAIMAAAKQTADLIAQAERPIILAGHGIRLAEAAESFAALYEHLNIPVVCTWNAMDLIPHSHPLSVGKPGTVAVRAPNFAVQNSDLLISIGARLDNVVTAFNPAGFGREAKKVVVDADPNELAKHAFPIEVSLCSDAAAFITALRHETREQPPKDRSPWLQRCQEWKARYGSCDGQTFPQAGEISHYHLMDALSDAIPEDTLIVTGSSGLGVEVFYATFRNKPGQRVFLTSGLGAMGYGLPAAIGAGAAFKKRYIAIESDGSLQMNIQEFQTLAAQKLPVTLFIINNNGYASIRNTQRNYFDGRYVGTGPEAGLFIADIPGMAESMGVPAMRITDAKDLKSGIQEALAHPGPFVCNVRVTPNEALWPKSAAIPQPDGSMISMPLEDMSPLLPRAELKENMLIPLAEASLKIQD